MNNNSIHFDHIGDAHWSIQRYKKAKELGVKRYWKDSDFIYVPVIGFIVGVWLSFFNAATWSFMEKVKTIDLFAAALVISIIPSFLVMTFLSAIFDHFFNFKKDAYKSAEAIAFINSDRRLKHLYETFDKILENDPENEVALTKVADEWDRVASEIRQDKAIGSNAETKSLVENLHEDLETLKNEFVIPVDESPSQKDAKNTSIQDKVR